LEINHPEAIPDDFKKAINTAVQESIEEKTYGKTYIKSQQI
jgi:hypothetical protein